MNSQRLTILFAFVLGIPGASIAVGADYLGEQTRLLGMLVTGAAQRTPARSSGRNGAGVELDTVDPRAEDPDEQESHRRRLPEITSAARRVHARGQTLDEKIRPLWEKRTPFDAQVKVQEKEFNRLNVESQDVANYGKAAERRAKLAINDVDRQAALNDANAAQIRYNELDAKARVVLKYRDAAKVQLDGLDALLKPLFDEKVRLRRELDQLETDWLAIRTPELKFGRSDAETLFDVADEWIRLHPESHEAFAWRALAYWQLGRRDQAIADAEKGCEIWKMRNTGAKRLPPWIRGWAVHGMLLQTTRQKSAGEKSLGDARRESGARDPFVLTMSGIAKLETRKPAQAIGEFRAALKQDPEFVPALHRLASLLVTSHDPKIRDVDKGLEFAEQAWIVSGRRSWRILETLARAYIAADQPDDAERAIERLRSLIPKTEGSRVTELEELLSNSAAR
ncbi:MAG: hypothetical protein NT069_12135 [Planctomycetota bacterium]|nr:hypothetical protein [Planctomycetota bacterium]